MMRAIYEVMGIDEFIEQKQDSEVLVELINQQDTQRRNSQMNEAQINAAEQAKEELRVESLTKANVDETHESRLKHMASRFDDADAKVVLDVLIIKHPFVVIDALKEYFVHMDKDLRSLRNVFTDREINEQGICGGKD